MVFGHFLSYAKKAIHNAGSGLNFLGNKIKGGVDWLKGTTNKIDKTLKSNPMIAPVYEKLKKMPIQQLGGRSLEDIASAGERGLDIASRVGTTLQSQSFGEGMARARGLAKELPENQRALLERGFGFAERGRRLMRSF